MKRGAAISAFSITVVLALNIAFAEPSPKVETITGRVVAYADGLACLNGNAYWSMLVQVQDDTKADPTKFIQVRFSLRCQETPQWLNRKSLIQKFRLKREQDSDSVLKEFVACAPDSAERCPQLPMWRFVPGAEDEKLPFGHEVPSYRSVDMPLAPAV